MIDVVERNGAVEFEVRVVPRASRNEFAGELGGAVRVRVTSPPVGGSANREVEKLIARQLGLPLSCVGIVSGHASRRKRIRIEGATAEQVHSLLA